MRHKRTFALVIAVLFLASSVALQSTALKADVASRIIIVPDDFPTIQAAIDNATAGDTVYVRAGNYTLPERYDRDLQIGESISLIGEDCQDTIITTTEEYSVVFGWSIGIALSANATLSGFTIIGNVNVLLVGGCLTNNIINLTANGDTAIMADSGIISNNIINGGRQGVASQDLGSGNIGISTDTDANTTISNNIINGFGTGIWFDGIQGLSNTRIINNTITNNNVGLSVIGYPGSLQENNIVNSTAYAMNGMVPTNATYNWWGTNDAQTISNLITTSNHVNGNVTFAPFLTMPNPQAMPTQNIVTVITTQETTQSRLLVNLAINGNITSSQMSNVTIATNQEANTTTLSFIVIGESGTGFGNITIPISEVPYGTAPTIYIDGLLAQTQGYTQDANNYYVWYTTSFSTHQISIVFTTPPSPTPTVPELSWLAVTPLIVGMFAVTVALRHRKTSKLKK